MIHLGAQALEVLADVVPGVEESTVEEGRGDAGEDQGGLGGPGLGREQAGELDIEELFQLVPVPLRLLQPPGGR